MLDNLEWHTEQRKVADLIPWQGNPRQMTEKQAKDLRTSLERLNLISIPAIDTNNTLVSGHQRCKILVMIGRGEEVIDVRVPNRKLTEDEFKEANLRENKNLGEWDLDLLANFDTEMLLDVGWTDEELTEIFQTEMPGEPKGEGQELDESEKPEDRDPLNINKFNCYTSNKFGIPELLLEENLPEIEKLIPFNYFNHSKDRDGACHFFLYDYMFERVWNNPDAYLDILRSYQCVLAPDFSLYTDYPAAMQIWNTYRKPVVRGILAD